MVCSGASAEAPPRAITSGLPAAAPLSPSAISVALSGRAHSRPGRPPSLLRLGARLYWRIRFEGIQHIPADGPLIIAPNHVTYADPVLV